MTPTEISETDVVERLQAALAFWMPKITDEIERELNGRAGDDAHLLAGFTGAIPSPSWGDAQLTLIDRLIAERDAAREAANAAQLLKNLRASGWMVAVHNDYRLNGEFHTFWLLAHANGRWMKGEGKTDIEALVTLSITPYQSDATASLTQEHKDD